VKKLMVLLAVVALAVLAFSSSPTGAQDDTEYWDWSDPCDQVLYRTYTGDYTLTPAELLSCGMSPEAIGAGPSINGPYGVGTDNVCSDLPQGSPESVACFEELIASMGY